jgi:hypothetical protein
VILCWLGLLLWFRRTSVAAACGVSADAVALLLITQLVFGMTFGLDVVQGLIVGVLVSGLGASAPAPAPSAGRIPAQPLGQPPG